jgi:hypothetical protein
MEKSVAAVMTAPRYEAVFARNYIESALRTCGIPLAVSGGVYYGQCMQRMLTDLCEKPVDYVLTIDFDSLFTAKHVQRLMSVIASEDGIDAVAAVQPKRGAGTVLASVDKESDLEWNGYPLRVNTAHFGLTVIDLDKLRSVPKPWFMAEPNSDGEWEGDKIDDDVYFWRQWRLAGHSCYIDPGCRLGHLEEMVTIFDPEMQLQHMYTEDWKAIRESTVD